MTEEDARTKWCPFARYEGWNGAAGSNRWKQSTTDQDQSPHALNPVPCRCIGSACMAWEPVTGYGGNGDCGLKRSKP